LEFQQAITTLPRHTFALIEKLHGVGGNRQTMADMTITSHDTVDMSSKFSSLIFVDGVRNVSISALHLDLVLMHIESTLIMSFLQLGSKLF
jgi:hypothetical protein